MSGQTNRPKMATKLKQCNLRFPLKSTECPPRVCWCLNFILLFFYSNSTQLNIICTIWWGTSTDYNHVSFCKCVFEADQHESGWWTDTDEWRARFNKTDRLTLTDLWRLQVVTHRPGTQIKGGESVRRESCLGQLRREGGEGKRGRKIEQRLQGVTCFIDVCPLFLWREKWAKY